MAPIRRVQEIFQRMDHLSVSIHTVIVKETGFDLDFSVYCESSVDINVLWKKSMITVTVH